MPDLPSPLPDDGAPRRHVRFCGYCGERGDPSGDPAVRICGHCEMGLLLRASADAAPLPGEAFLVVDELLTIRAVSRHAERFLRQSETSLVSRQVGEVLSPADAAPDPDTMITTLLAAAMRDAALAKAPVWAAVRPSDAYGVRFGIRIAGCQPGPAALLVFEERL